MIYLDIKSLQTSDGCFVGDEYGETDTRFTYCAVSCASLLGGLDQLNTTAAISYLEACRNPDGYEQTYDRGFGSVPGAESHAGQSIFVADLVFCCVGALDILDALHLVDADKLGWWLCERQLPCGGFNGRPEKLEDVCYSWWVLSSLCMINRQHWIDGPKLIEFILSAQVISSI